MLTLTSKCLKQKSKVALLNQQPCLCVCQLYADDADIPVFASCMLTKQPFLCVCQLYADGADIAVRLPVVR